MVTDRYKRNHSLGFSLFKFFFNFSSYVYEIIIRLFLDKWISLRDFTQDYSVIVSCPRLKLAFNSVRFISTPKPNSLVKVVITISIMYSIFFWWIVHISSVFQLRTLFVRKFLNLTLFCLVVYESGTEDHNLEWEYKDFCIESTVGSKY